MIQIVNGSIGQSHWLACLYRLFNDSVILACDPSSRKILAFAPSLAVSSAAAALDRDVDRGWTCHGYLAARCALLQFMALGTRHFLFVVGFWLYSQSGQHFSVEQLSGVP